MTANRSGYSRPEPMPADDRGPLVAARWNVAELARMARAIGQRANRAAMAADDARLAGMTPADDAQAELARLMTDWRAAYSAYRVAAGLPADWEHDR